MSSPEDDIDVDTMVFVFNKDDKLETEEDIRMLDDEASFEAEDIRPSEPIADNEIDIKTKTFSNQEKKQKLTFEKIYSFMYFPLGTDIYQCAICAFKSRV